MYSPLIFQKAPLVHIAAQKADLTLLKKLKESDCELNIRNKNGNNGWFQTYFFNMKTHVFFPRYSPPFKL